MSDERTSFQVRGSSAHICHELGWYPGTYIRGNIPTPITLRITAVGEEFVLAREIVDDEGQVSEGDEMVRILTERDWRKIEPLKAEA